MYRIEKVPSGFILTFGGIMSKGEVERWVAESKVALQGKIGGFGVLIDMRNLKPLALDAQEVLKQGQKLYKDAGMQRSAVVLNDPLQTLQFQRIAKTTGIYEWERYIDASKDPDFKQTAIDWLTKGIDPDKQD